MRKAGDVLESLLKNQFGQDFSVKARQTAGLFSSWGEICAEAWSADYAAASHSRIRDYEKGALLVEADHPGWVQLLLTKQQQLLAIARRHFPELDLRSISFCLSREPFTFAEKEAPVQYAPPENERPEREREGERQSASPQTEIKKSENEEYYDALKRFEASVKERNIKP